MCGISGGYDLDRVKRLANIAYMTEHQHKRGPDNRAITTVDDVTFGHNRLAIIDLTQSGDQPAKTDRFLLTYNGEIYNYKDFSIAPNDTLALLYSIQNKGVEATLPLLNGMYAFGVYDNKENKIHLVSDRFAQKPLYYYHSGARFYFASTPAALYELESSWQINRDALQSYWLLGSVMSEYSIFCGIKKLNASEHLTYDILTNSVKIERYWEPQFQTNTNGIEDLVLDAIRLTKVSDVTIHIFLSGGIDSTLVASQHLEGLAIHLDSPERQYAQQAADRFGIDLKIVYPESIQTASYLTDYSKQCGEPTMAGLIPYTTAKEVSKYGKVAISANGADELFFGYDWLYEQYSSQQSTKLYRESAFGNQGKRYGFEFPGTRGVNGRGKQLYSYVQFDLNKTLDFASMCHSLEVRNPFLDHRLVEMALSIPEKEHRANGNKTILKRMLKKMGFADEFLNRPKLGFSLHRKPERLDILIKGAFDWVQQNEFLNIKGLSLSERDRKYLEMSALGFFYWFKAWENKIK